MHLFLTSPILFFFYSQEISFAFLCTHILSLSPRVCTGFIEHEEFLDQTTHHTAHIKRHTAHATQHTPHATPSPHAARHTPW
jgi:hypothetical protein